MTQPPDTPYIYVPPSFASGLPSRYFEARHYAHMHHSQLEEAARKLESYAPKTKKEKGRGMPALPQPPRDRGKAKGDILAMLQKLVDSAPLEAPEREALQSAWLDVHLVQDKDTAIHHLGIMQDRLEHACDDLVPHTLKCNPNSIAGLRDRNIVNQLQHMREVYDACISEVKRHQCELTRELTPNFLKLERRMGMTLSLARLDGEVNAGLRRHARDDSEIFHRVRDDRMMSSVRNAVTQFEAYMDRAYPKWRDKDITIPDDWELKDQQEPMTLGDLTSRLRSASNDEQLKPYADLLHHVVAKRAYYFKRDLVKAYDEDQRNAQQVIAGRNSKRNNDVYGENPFEGHQEIISAAYKAKWAKSAKDLVKLMRRYEHTLEDPAVTAKADTPTTLVGERDLFGVTTQPVQAKDARQRR